MVAVAIGGAALVGGAASIASSNKASSTAADTAAANNALQSQIYNENKETLAPFVAQGAPATNSINALLGLGGDSAATAAAYQTYKDSTGYQASLKQGQNSVTAALGSKGLLDSGAAQKALLTYGQNAEDAKMGTYLSALQGQQNVGLTAASAQAGVSTGYANSVSANNTAASNTASNAALSNASTINSALGNSVSAYGYSQGLGSSYGSGTNAYGINNVTGDGIY